MKPLIPERVLRPELVDGFVVCPACNGLPVVTPYDQKNDKVCQLCKGQSVVNPALVCIECGRPAMYQHEETKILFCGSHICLEELKKRWKTKQNVAAIVVASMALQNDEDSYREYWNTHGMT